MLSAGLIPFLYLCVQIVAEAATGDPPNNLREFKMYHYESAAAVLLAVAWWITVAVSFRYQHRWVIAIAFAWVLVTAWVAYDFLRGLNAHPAGAYYRSLW